MEQKEIKINIAGPSPLRRIMKKPGFWFFMACALIVFIGEAYAGNIICCIWIILAAVGYFFSDLFDEYSDDLFDLCVTLIEEGGENVGDPAA